MADSISGTQESCVCVIAHHGVPLLRKPKPDHFFIDVFLSISVYSDIPTDLRTFSRTTDWTSTELLEYPRQAFLSGTDEEHREIITNMIQSLEIPFPLENLHWNMVRHFPIETRTETFDEIISRIVSIARDQARKDESEGQMGLNIKKKEKISPEDYRKFCAEKERRERQEKGPLEEWIWENQNEKTLQEFWCLDVIWKLKKMSPTGNKCFGLKSVEGEEETEDEKGCRLCSRSLKKGCQAIRMPCSHVFHGFCIFRWIAWKPTCPLCRFTVAEPNEWRIS